MNKKKEIPIVILHGWGVSMSGRKYDELKKLLEKDGYTVYTPDLPGFGNNPIGKDVLVFEDYIQFVHNFITQKIKQKKVILLGHSFGGRVAIKFTVQYPELVDVLILTGASGIPRPLPSVKKRLVYGITKLTRPLFSIPPLSFVYRFFRKAVYYSIGEMDYYKAGSLTQTFKNVYQVSVIPDLDKISVPTLLIWAQLDTFTPVSDGKLMHEKIPQAQMVIVPAATHRLPYEEPKAFEKAIISFLS